MKITEEIRSLGDRAQELNETQGYDLGDGIYAAMDEKNIQDRRTRIDRYSAVWHYLRLKKRTKAEAQKKREAARAQMELIQPSLF